MRTEHSAGAILYTLVNGVPHYVLVRENSGHTGFPKGHVEAGETLDQTALREIREEVGIEATLLSNEPMWTERNKLSSGKEKQVDYFLACFEGQTPVARKGEVARVRVLPIARAQDYMTFESRKGFLAQAEEYILKKC